MKFHDSQGGNGYEADSEMDFPAGHRGHAGLPVPRRPGGGLLRRRARGGGHLPLGRDHQRGGGKPGCIQYPERGGVPGAGQRLGGYLRQGHRRVYVCRQFAGRRQPGRERRRQLSGGAVLCGHLFRLQARQLERPHSGRDYDGGRQSGVHHAEGWADLGSEQRRGRPRRLYGHGLRAGQRHAYRQGEHRTAAHFGLPRGRRRADGSAAESFP